MSNLSKETIDRIESDAIAYVEKTRGQQGRVETYVSGALTEAERAQGLVEALELCAKPMMHNDANLALYARQEVAQRALAKYKEVTNER